MSNKKILIIDDEELIRHSLKTDLSAVGFTVSLAENGKEGLKKFKVDHHDAVLTDLMMAGMDGIDVLKKVKEEAPETVVIILTGFANVNSAISALRSGADDFLNKPCSTEDILIRLEREFEKKDLIARIKENEAKLRAITQTANDAIIMVNSSGEATFWNKAAERIFGYTEQEILGKDIHKRLVPETYMKAYSEHFHTFSLTGTGPVIDKTTELFALNKEGKEFPIELSLSSVRIDSEWHAVGIIKDISRRWLAEKTLRENEAQYRQFIEGTDNLVCQVDTRGKFTFVNHMAHPFFGLEPKKCLGRSLFDFIHPEDRQSTEELFNDIVQGKRERITLENRILNAIGETHDMLWTMNHHYDDENNSIVAVNSTARDITERKESEKQIWKLANFDVLTGLPNRALFMERLSQAIFQSTRTGKLLCLMFIDLDNFKNVNDSLGHQAGDDLLVEVAQRLNYCLRQTDTIARLGGDEFTVILTNITQQSDAEPVIRQLLQSLARPFIVGRDNEVHITASIGVTFCPDDATDEQTLMRYADTAMYRAKGSGKNRSAHFSPSLDQ